MSPAACAAASESIRTTIPTLPRWQAARVIAAFWPLPDEPDLQPLGWTPERTVLLPRVRSEDMIFHRVTSPDQLTVGAFGVQEPDPAQCPAVDPGTADLIFVPGVAFTPEGDRLGRGRGFYDRLLSLLPARVLRAGVCFRAQVLERLPLESHDRRVDVVLTSPD
jgi:5-formyltetrahydrofolate cyclo-ligase